MTSLVMRRPIMMMTMVSSRTSPWNQVATRVLRSALPASSYAAMSTLPPTSNHKHFPLTNAQGSVIYTETDEAPALATYSLYPVVSKVRLYLYIV
jgi:hypothetical protein